MRRRVLESESAFDDHPYSYIGIRLYGGGGSGDAWDGAMDYRLVVRDTIVYSKISTGGISTIYPGVPFVDNYGDNTGYLEPFPGTPKPSGLTLTQWSHLEVEVWDEYNKLTDLESSPLKWSYRPGGYQIHPETSNDVTSIWIDQDITVDPDRDILICNPTLFWGDTILASFYIYV